MIFKRLPLYYRFQPSVSWFSIRNFVVLHINLCYKITNKKIYLKCSFNNQQEHDHITKQTKIIFKSLIKEKLKNLRFCASIFNSELNIFFAVTRTKHLVRILKLTLEFSKTILHKKT